MAQQFNNTGCKNTPDRSKAGKMNKNGGPKDRNLSQNLVAKLRLFVLCFPALERSPFSTSMVEVLFILAHKGVGQNPVLHPP